MKTLADMTVLIVGLGQIGGSLGKDLVQHGLIREVLGYDSDPETGRQARECGAIHSMVPTLDEGIGHADIIILATPIRQIITQLPQVLDKAGKESVVLDVGSTKEKILAAGAKIIHSGNYIGGHPLAGSENIGLAAAEEGKFRGKTFILVPAPGTTETWQEKISELIFGIGAIPLKMNADEHDRLFALTSSLPHVFALALGQLAIRYRSDTENLARLCGGSFHSAVRVAGSSPDLIIDMFRTNQKNICNTIDEIITQLMEIRESIARGDERFLREIIDNVQQHCPGLGDG